MKHKSNAPLYDRYDLKEVRRAAEDRWLLILSALSSGEFDEAIGKVDKTTHVACPFHQRGEKPKKAKFRLNSHVNKEGDCVISAICTCGNWSDGFSLLMDLNGWSFIECLEEVAVFLNVRPVEEGTKSKSTKPKKKVISLDKKKSAWLAAAEEEMAKRKARNEKYQKSLSANLKKTWSECIPLDHEDAKPARIYFERRGLKVPTGPDTRFHKGLPYWDEDGNKVGVFPVWVGLIRSPDGEFSTIHRHYLTRDGKKAGVPCPKKMCPVPEATPLQGGAIRAVVPSSGIVGVAEGMETALSAWTATGIPTWACVSASIMQNFEPPAGIHTVIVWADKDRKKKRSGNGKLVRAGRESAFKLKEKLSALGVQTIILFPPMDIPEGAKGVDWNDVLMEQGPLGFPTIKQILADVPEYLVKEVCNDK